MGLRAGDETEVVIEGRTRMVIAESIDERCYPIEQVSFRLNEEPLMQGSPNVLRTSGILRFAHRLLGFEAFRITAV